MGGAEGQLRLETGAPEGAPVGPAPDEEVYDDAMARAGRLLSVRPRTVHELRTRLATADVPEAVVERAIERLGELGLVDDAAFAREWVEERARRRGRGPAALVAELEGKGISREDAEAAVAAVGLDEEAQARELAARLLSRVIERPLREQGHRLHAMLVRRGISPEAATAGVRAVLPPEGWD